MRGGKTEFTAVMQHCYDVYTQQRIRYRGSERITEPVFVNVKGAQESVPRSRFRLNFKTKYSTSLKSLKYSKDIVICECTVSTQYTCISLHYIFVCFLCRDSL